MKAINYLVLGLVCFGSLTLTAQKKTFTMAEAVNGLSSKLAVANWKQLQWAGEQYVYVVNTDSQHVVMSGDPKTRLTHELLSLAELNQALTQKGLHTLKAFPALTFKSETDFYFSNEQQHVECIRRENTWEATLITELPADADPVNVDAGSMHLAYISNDNLYIGGKDLPTRQLTQDGSRDIVYGDSIHRNEFGIEQCMFWSGSGTRLAFYRMDQSMVEAYPIINWNSTPATVNKIRYPFAGRTSHQVQVGVYDINSGHIVYMQTGLPADQYLTTVTWSPDEKYIYISLLNREQNHLRLNQYDAHSGTLIKTLFEEQRDTYVEPQHPLYFLSGDPNHFLWWSQRDGYMHLYRCTTDGDIDTLMHGNWIVNDILGYNPKTSELIYTGTEDSPLQKNVYAIHLNK